MKLEQDFYTRDNVVQISKSLLGKYLYTNFNGQLTGGKIVETEAYCGTTDQACHAYGGKRTPRTAPFYEVGGISYVYYCYGIHHLFNVITNEKDKADAVLIRAIEPTVGLDLMLKRRKMTTPKVNLTAGPACVAKALGITVKQHNGINLQGEQIWIADKGEILSETRIKTGVRVGLGYAGEAAFFPWRFSIKDNKWVSKANLKY